MALIKCPECEKEISDQASTCPNCGCPVTKTGMAMFSEQTSYAPTKSKFPVVPVIVVSIIVILIGFAIYYINTKKPSGMDDEIYTIGKSAVKVIDDYLDNSADYDTTYRKLDGLADQVESVIEEKDISYSPIEYDISFLRSELYREYSGRSNYSDLLEKRNELAEELNLSTRNE